MAFKLGDVIVDRLQFGYGATSKGNPLYALTQLTNANIDITADSTDITDKDGNLVYRKYLGKKGEVTATNAFMNLAVIEAISGTSAEIAEASKGIVMPIITTVAAGSTLDITDYVEDSIVVNALSAQGSMGKQYTAGTNASESEFKVDKEGHTLTPPTDANETQYLVKYKKTVKSGARVGISANKFPKSHELFFKALVVDKCETDVLKAAIIHIPSFMPSPEVTIALQGGDSQNMDYKGAILTNTCGGDQDMVEIYFIDEEEEDV